MRNRYENCRIYSHQTPEARTQNDSHRFHKQTNVIFFFSEVWFRRKRHAKATLEFDKFWAHISSTSKNDMDSISRFVDLTQFGEAIRTDDTYYLLCRYVCKVTSVWKINTLYVKLNQKNHRPNIFHVIFSLCVCLPFVLLLPHQHVNERFLLSRRYDTRANWKWLICSAIYAIGPHALEYFPIYLNKTNDSTDVQTAAFCIFCGRHEIKRLGSEKNWRTFIYLCRYSLLFPLTINK